MGFIKALVRLLTGQLDATPSMASEDAIPQPPSSFMPSSLDVNKQKQHIISPASVNKQVTVNGKVITDPAEIARVEEDFAATFGGGKIGKLMEEISDAPTQDILARMKDVAATGNHYEVKTITKRAWRNGQEITDPGEVEKMLEGFVPGKKED